MKKVFLVNVLFLLFIHCYARDFDGAIIKGKVKNSNQEYVVLSYAPWYRGNLNYDGFNSIGTKIDNNGIFILSSQNITHASYYNFFVKDKLFSLILFKGDNITLEFDFNNIDSSLFALGKGAGKINVLKLQQFIPGLDFKTKYAMDNYKSRVDSVITFQLGLLELIYKKDSKNKIIENALNKKTINKIIDKTPLSEVEYEFLKNKISLLKFLVGNFLSYLSAEKRADTSQIDFSNSYFNCFNEQEYKIVNSINNWAFSEGLSNILLVEYIKNKIKDYPHMNYSKWDSYIDYPQFDDWSKSFVKANFNSEVFEMYCAEDLLYLMTLGHKWHNQYQYFAKYCNNSKYLSRINKFKDLLENGLNNAEYNLNADKFNLTSSKLDSLIESNKGEIIYLIIWSAQYAGASIIPDLPSIIDFEKEYTGKIRVFSVCIDKAKYKSLWAARIIDNSWKGNHYFLQKEGNDLIIDMFDAKKIFSFCYDGATYILIDQNGNLINKVDSPLMMSKDKIDTYLKNTVR